MASEASVVVDADSHCWSAVQLTRMLAYVQRLSKLEADGGEDAPAHVNVFREDVVEDAGLASEIVGGAPQARENQFQVPKTFANE